MSFSRGRAPRIQKVTEHVEQTLFVQWVAFQFPFSHKRLFAVPNGEYRTMPAARRLKAEGTRAGVSDLILLQPVGRYHGFVIEFKKATETWSSVRKAQQEFLYQAQEDGYAAAVAFGFEHGKELMGRYLMGHEVTVDFCKDYLRERKK